MILVDTSAWIHHLRKSDRDLVDFLLAQRVRTCDVVIGELMLGAGVPGAFKRDLLALPKVPSPAPAETLSFIQRHGRTFAGSGVGWADAQIMHAALAAGARLYTSDKGVKRVCRAIGAATT